MDIYEQWAKTVKDAVNRFASSQPREVKQDFEQECFIELIGDTDKIAKINDSQGWEAANKYVYSICHNRVYHLTKSQNKYFSTMLADGLYPVPDEPEPKKFMGLEESDIDDAIKTLPRKQQYVIRGLMWQNKTESQLAKELKISQPRVNKIKMSALDSLKELLKEK